MTQKVSSVMGGPPRRWRAMIALLAPVLVGGLLAAPAPGAAARAEGGHEAAAVIHASKAWARPTVHGAHAGVVYLTLSNAGGREDVLTGLDTPVADQASVHETVVKDGIARMRAAAEGVVLPAGGTVVLRPEGLHVMLLGLRQQLLPGDVFPLNLHFRHAPDAQVAVTVLEPGGPAPR